MKGGRLEVFLVSSKGIKKAGLFWIQWLTMLLFLKPAYYVITECGTQVSRSKSKTLKGSKIAGHRNKIYWNDKLTFEFPISECENLTYLKLKIMEAKYLRDDKFTGETIIDLKRIIMEGNERGFIELTSSLYNVVLEDGTYKGELKIGLRFTPNTDIYQETNELMKEDHEEPQRTMVSKGLMNLGKMSRWRFSNLSRSLNNGDKQKET